MSKNSSEQHIFKELRKEFPGLSEEEFDLFKAVMSHKDETFLFSRRIQFTLGSLITQVYEEVNVENYNNLAKRLLILANFRESYQNKEGECGVHSLLSPLSINKEDFLEFEEVVVTAYISPIVLDHYRSR